jgi:hypothetical protein
MEAALYEHPGLVAGQLEPEIILQGSDHLDNGRRLTKTWLNLFFIKKFLQNLPRNCQ